MAVSQPSPGVAQPDPSPIEHEKLQAQEARILEPGVSSSESIEISQLAQDNVQPHVEVEEGITTETDQLLPNDELQVSSKQEPSSAADVPGRLIEGRALNSRANEDLVTLSLATLQQLVEYCVQVVRESKELKTRIPDPERDGIARTPLTGLSSDEDFSGISRVLPRHESTSVFVGDIWREVIPFKLGESQDIVDGISGQDESMLLARCLGEDDIDFILRPTDVRQVGSVRGDALRLRHLIHAWKKRVPAHNPPVAFNYRVMVVMLEALDQGELPLVLFLNDVTSYEYLPSLMIHD